jgi:antirestriction protein ArdC
MRMIAKAAMAAVEVVILVGLSAMMAIAAIEKEPEYEDGKSFIATWLEVIK